MYPAVFVVWLPWAVVVLDHPGLFTGHPFRWLRPHPWLGWPLFLLGCALQAWTAMIMGHRIIGIPELHRSKRQALVERPPFTWCRHPTYLSHHLIFLGLLFITGETASLVLFLLDVAVTQLIIIPLEERELLQRLGDRYRRYAARTPRLLPRIWR